jgi:hypothetical protein
MNPDFQAQETAAYKAALALLVLKAGGYLEVTADDLKRGATIELSRKINPVNGSTVFRTN